MSSKVRFGIVAASLCLTAALIWSGAGLTMLFTHWISEHPALAKGISALLGFVLPLVALVLYRRRSRDTIAA